MILPRLHGNGDTPATLIAALDAQIVALDAALQVMVRSRPNSRNYTAATYGPADDQHSDRLAQIAAVQHALLDELAWIEAQQRPVQ